MAKNLLEKLAKEKQEHKQNKTKDPTLLLDLITTIPSTEPTEELAIELRDYFFGTKIDSYLFEKEIIVSYHELGQAFIDLNVIKNYSEFNKILSGLNNLKIKYDTWWQACQLEIKRIPQKTKKVEENLYLIKKNKVPFSKEKQMINPTKGNNISLKDIIEGD